ncbi:MAG TPA: hypothetical protein DEP97_14415 [Erythrobacter sp.]|nr:hypothetical protein [Erythrobacter sp.]
MVDDKRSGSTIINYGNNNQIAGRDMSQVYQNIAQNNDVEMARAIAEIGRIIEEKGGPETQEQFEAFSHELSQEKPKPGVLKAMWKSMVDTVPKIAKIAASVAPLAKLLGLV